MRQPWSAHAAAALVLTIFSLGCQAEGRTEPAVVGELWYVDAKMADESRKALHESLAASGWHEGENVRFVPRFADGNPATLPALADELATMRVDVMFVSAKAVGAARRATQSIPIVSAAMSDPVAEGFASSLQHPSANVTGLSWQSVETSGKRLELAREFLPRMRRIGILFDASDQGAQLEKNALDSAARTVGLEVKVMGASGASGVASALARLKRAHVQALFVPQSPLTVLNATQILAAAVRARIPVIAEGRHFAQAGALVAYGPSALDAISRAAGYVDKLLRGSQPGDLPIEQPLKFELVVNRKTAKALRLTIPYAIELRADELLGGTELAFRARRGIAPATSVIPDMPAPTRAHEHTDVTIWDLDGNPQELPPALDGIR